MKTFISTLSILLPWAFTICILIVVPDRYVLVRDNHNGEFFVRHKVGLLYRYDFAEESEASARDFMRRLNKDAKDFTEVK